MRSSRGFSLIEITVGSVIFSLIMGAAFFLLISYGRVSARGEAISEALNAGRTAVMKIAEDVRNARYLYHYAEVKFEDSVVYGTLPVRKGLPDDGTLIYPMVTTGGFVENRAPKAPPQITDSKVFNRSSGADGLKASSLTMMVGNTVNPHYVCWLRHPGPAKPAAPTDDEKKLKSLWYRLLRLEATCSEFTEASTQGKWQRMSHKWSAYTGASSMSAIVFPGVKKTDGSGQTCGPTHVAAYGHAVNSDLFIWKNPHPASREFAISPYWVEYKLQMGDPFNNYLRTGSGGVAVPSGNWQITAVTLRGEAFAQNVTLPSPEGE